MLTYALRIRSVCICTHAPMYVFVSEVFKSVKYMLLPLQNPKMIQKIKPRGTKKNGRSWERKYDNKTMN